MSSFPFFLPFCTLRYLCQLWPGTRRWLFCCSRGNKGFRWRQSLERQILSTGLKARLELFSQRLRVRWTALSMRRPAMQWKTKSDLVQNRNPHRPYVPSTFGDWCSKASWKLLSILSLKLARCKCKQTAG